MNPFLSISKLQARVAAEEQAAGAARTQRAHQPPTTTTLPQALRKPEPRPLTVPHPFQLQSEAIFD